MHAGLFVEERPPDEPAGAARLVVLVHGSMDRHRSFLRLQAKLRQCHVVLYDRRGYSRSQLAVPPAAGLSDHVDDLVHVLGGREAVVFGHSYGGDVALAAACRSPLVRAVVVYEAPLPWLRWWHSPGVPYEREPFAGMDAGDAALGFVARMIGSRRLERLGEETRANLRADAPALVAELTSLRRSPAPFDPDQVRVPVWVGYGGSSTPRHRQGAGWLVARLPDARLAVLDGARHNAHVSHPAEVAALVREAVALAWPPAGNPGTS